MKQEIKINYSILLFGVLYFLSFIIIFYLDSLNLNSLFFSLLMSFVFIYYGVFRVNLKINNALQWNKINALVVCSWAQEKRCIGVRQENIFTPYIKYKYTINGNEYINDAWNIQDCIVFYSEKEAKSIVKQYSENSTINVFVNPKNNSKSYIFQGDIEKLYVSYVLMLLTTALPLCSLAFYLSYM